MLVICLFMKDPQSPSSLSPHPMTVAVEGLAPTYEIT